MMGIFHYHDFGTFWLAGGALGDMAAADELIVDAGLAISSTASYVTFSKSNIPRVIAILRLNGFEVEDRT